MLTRAGNFSLDGNGNLVTANGEQVLGTATVDGNDPNTVKAVQVPTTLVIYKERDAANNVLQTWIGDSSTSAPSPTMGGTVGAEAVGLTSFSVGQDGGITAIYSNGDRLTVRTDPTSTNQNLREFSVILSDGSTFAPSSSGTTGILNIMNNTVTSEPVIYPEEMQLRIAKVTNTLGLVQIGQNNYQLGPNVGTVTMGIGSFAGRGSVAAGALESSNVDIAAEFTNMILAQRGVEAAGKVVSTQSDVLRTIINLL
jgi:flagellar hook protein FlgE